MSALVTRRRLIAGAGALIAAPYVSKRALAEFAGYSNSGGGGTSGLFGSALSALPTQAGTGLNTWLNQGSATATDVPTGISIQGVASQDWQLLKKAAPGTPYTVTALVVFGNVLPQNFMGVGIGFTDGAKLHGVHLQSTNNLIVSKWTTTTSFSANDVVVTTQNTQAVPVWVRIKDDATNAIFFYSFDGGTWTQAFTVAKSAGFLGSSGYTNIFFGVNSNTPATQGTLMSWAIS